MISVEKDQRKPQGAKYEQTTVSVKNMGIREQDAVQDRGE